MVDALNTLKPGGKVLINSKRSFEDERIIAFDAHHIAIDILGVPITNTVMLTILTMLLETISIKDIEVAIRLHMPPKLVQRNIELVNEVQKVFDGERVV